MKLCGTVITHKQIKCDKIFVVCLYCTSEPALGPSVLKNWALAEPNCNHCSRCTNCQQRPIVLCCELFCNAQHYKRVNSGATQTNEWHPMSEVSSATPPISERAMKFTNRHRRTWKLNLEQMKLGNLPAFAPPPSRAQSRVIKPYWCHLIIEIWNLLEHPDA